MLQYNVSHEMSCRLKKVQKKKKELRAQKEAELEAKGVDLTEATEGQAKNMITAQEDDVPLLF